MPTSQHTTSVEYREIGRFQGYRFGNDGSVWSRWQGCPSPKMKHDWHKLKIQVRHDGHYAVSLRSHFYLLHRLILEAFVGPCPPGMQCRHLDGNPGNNHPDNLAWGTKSENVQDAVRHGTHGGLKLKGEANPSAKLKEGDVRQIKMLLKQKLLFQREIAAQFGVTAGTIGAIHLGVIWRHVE